MLSGFFHQPGRAWTRVMGLDPAAVSISRLPLSFQCAVSLEGGCHSSCPFLAMVELSEMMVPCRERGWVLGQREDVWSDSWPDCVLCGSSLQ